MLEMVGLAVMVVLMVALLLVLGLALAMVHYVWWAWWTYPAWAWFVEPLGVPHVSLWAFIGLVILLHGKPTLDFATKEPTRTKSEWAGLVAGGVIGPIFVWVILRWLHHLAA